MQLDIFDQLYPTFYFDKKRPVRVVELFAGIGFQAIGMDLAEIPYEVVGTSEIDKFAITAYEAIHGHNPNLGSITDIQGIDMPKQIDLMTYSFPCTDLSKAGKQKGLNNTRSGLVYEVLRILAELQDIDNLPKVLIMENVVDLVQSKFIKQFNEIQLELEQLGYTNYVQKLNAKNYGIAQNRDRVFMVSILGEWNYNFPKEFKLDNKLLHYLEDEVDEKYYLTDRQVDFIKESSYRSNNIDSVHEITGICKTLDTMQGGNREPKIFCNVNPSGKGMNGNVWQGDMSLTLTTNKGEGPKIVEPIIQQKSRGYNKGSLLETCPSITSNSWHENNYLVVPEATEKGFDEAYPGDSINLEQPNSKTRRGRVGKSVVNTLTTSCNQGVVTKRELTNSMLKNGHLKEYDMIRHSYTNNRQEDIERTESLGGICATLTTRSDTLGVVEPKDGGLFIRKLTPIETGRLMGMNDDQIAKQREVMSNAQMYKQHGNGIVAQVIGLIIGMMWYEDEEELKKTVRKNSLTWLTKEMQ